MIVAPKRRLPIVAATVLFACSFSLAGSQPSTTHAAPTHPAPVRHKAHKASRHSTKQSRKHPRGQQAIDGQRTRQIQEALVREHYMSSEPTGNWDDTTQAAMRRYQADQGWQSKTVPDSRALIRLGLGPDHVHLLNPETAMTTMPQFPHGSSTTRAGQMTGRAQSAPNARPASMTPVSVPVAVTPDSSSPR